MAKSLDAQKMSITNMIVHDIQKRKIGILLLNQHKVKQKAH